jgi:hypothetical protein
LTKNHKITKIFLSVIILLAVASRYSRFTN